MHSRLIESVAVSWMNIKSNEIYYKGAAFFLRRIARVLNLPNAWTSFQHIAFLKDPQLLRNFGCIFTSLKIVSKQET